MPRPPASTPIRRTCSIRDEGVEDAHRVAAAADAGDDRVRQPAELLEALRPRFAADHRLELAHHQRIRMRAEHRAEQVVGVGDVGHPVAHRLVDRVLQRLRAGVDLDHFGAEQPHAEDVERLARHVVGAHVDVALEPEQRADGRGRDAVLPGAGLGDDPPLPHADREQRLAERVVDLVRAGVREVLALEHDARAAGGRGQPLRFVERRRAADVIAQQVARARSGTLRRRGP